MRGRYGTKGLAAVLLVAGLAACDDDASGPERVRLADVEGLYATATLTFDPQGSAPAADVLQALEAAGTSPTVNISASSSNFQLFYRDPISGDISTVSGTVQPTVAGVDLVFGSPEEAAAFLLPLRLPLEWDAGDETLSFSGSADVSRDRLLDLFPELYAEEQLFDPTPGQLNVQFQRTPPEE